jgi:peptidyl-prolyl cis-trans isomerase SurA
MGKDSFFLKPAFHSGCRKKDRIKCDGMRQRVHRWAALSVVTSALLTMVTTAVPLPSFAVEIVDRVVAIVNNEVVSLYELNRSVAPFIEQIQSSQYPEDVARQLKFEVRQKVLQELIDQKLTDQELARLQITVSEDEVDRTIERMKEANFLTDEQLRAGLQRQGLSYEEYRERIKKQLLRAKLVNREIRSKIVITEEDIKQYYAKHAASYAGEKKYLLHNIYTRLPSIATEQEKQIALGIMEAIHQELINGKPFDTIAEEYAGSTATIESSNLGYFELDDLSEQLQGVIASMQAGSYTPVLETEFGYQIVYVESIEEVGGKTLEEVAPEIQKKLYDEVVDQKFESWLQVLRDRSHIKIIN